MTTHLSGRPAGRPAGVFEALGRRVGRAVETRGAEPSDRPTDRPIVAEQSRAEQSSWLAATQADRPTNLPPLALAPTIAHNGVRGLVFVRNYNFVASYVHRLGRLVVSDHSVCLSVRPLVRPPARPSSPPRSPVHRWYFRPVAEKLTPPVSALVPRCLSRFSSGLVLPSF